MEKLFNSLSEQGKYTKSFEDFQTQFGSKEGQEKLYGALKSSGDYTKSFGDFSNQFFAADPVKTNDSASADPAVESSQEDMGSRSEEPLSAWQSIKNTFKKAGERIYDVVEFWGTDEGANSGLDIATNSFYSLLSSQEDVDEYAKNNPGWMSEGLGSEATIKAIEKYKEEQDESNFATKGLVASAKEGDVGGIVAGTVESLVNAFSSGIYFLGTAGAGVFSEVAAENYITYNEQKAENLGVSLNELIRSGEADNLAPVGLGAVSVGLERFGFGKVLKATAGKNIIKNASAKLIYNRKARNVANILAAGGTEFSTEILQHATDKINEEFGRTAGTEDDAKFVQATFDAIFSEEGLEAGLQGLIGGGGMAGIGTGYRAMNTIRTTVDGDLIDKNLEDLSKLRVKLNKAADKTEKAGIQKLVDTKISEIADSVRKGKDIYNSLSEGQLKEIENLTDLADVAASQVIELDKKLRAGEIDKAGYDLAYQGFKSEYDGVRQQLIDMNLEQNIKTAEDIAKEKGLDLDVMTTAEVEALMNSNKVSEQNRKAYFDNKSKGSDVSAFAIGNKIVIDKDIARKTGSINAGMHEVLHPVFNKLIGNAEQQGKMVRQFRKSMTSSQRRFVDAEMKKRGYTGKEYNTEYVNVFSDALRKKQINYDKTTFEKIGDAVVSIFKPVGYTNVGFESGKDVYNFIKEFDQSAEQGKLTTKAAEALKDVDLSDAKLQDELQASKTLSDDVKTTLSDNITEIKNLAKENAAIAAKFGKEPIKGAKQIRLEREVIEGVKPLVEKIVTNRTKALYDKIADDAKRGVTREQFQESMRADIETMILNEYDATKQDLEKFAVSRAYLRANNLAKRLGIESVEEGGIKQDIDTAKGITEETTTTTKPKEPSVERGQATFDELDIVDDALIADIEKDLNKEIRTRVQKGTLSEKISVKKGRDTYLVTWLEDYVNKQLFKKLSKKLGAIGERNGKTVIPGAYIDFLNDPKTFDIITKALPIKSIKKSYSKLFPTERIGRELTAEGNPVFRIKKIDKKAFLTYFVEGKKTTILERQKQLFREILEPLAKQVVANYATPENLSELKSIQELAPAGSMDVIENIIIDAQLSDLESKLDRYSKEEAGFDIIQFSLTATEAAPKELAFIADLDANNILLKDSSKGRQKFYIERLEKYYKTREEFMSFLPPSITKFRGLTAGMLGFVYREDGSYYDFYKYAYKKVVDKKGETVTDKKRLNSLFEKGTAEYRNVLFDKKSDSSKYSKTTKKLLKEVNELIEKANLGRLTPNLHSGRIAVAKAELKPVVAKETAKEVLDHLSKNNKLNAKIAELYISLLRDFVKNSKNKKQAKSTVVNILLATNNTVNGWRSLASITSIIYNKNKVTDYYFEHNDSMRSVLPNILRQILGNGTISFNVDSSLIPKDLAKEKNKNKETKVGSRATTSKFYKKAIAENKDLESVSIQFSLNSATKIEVIENSSTQGLKSAFFTINGIEYAGGLTGFDVIRKDLVNPEPLIERLQQLTGNKNVETNKYQLFEFDRSDTGADVVSRDSAEWNGKRYVFPEADTKQSLAVFGSLSNYFLNEIKKGNLDGLVFFGAESSRKRLYETLSERFAKKLGWNYGVIEKEDKQGGNAYFIAKPAKIQFSKSKKDFDTFGMADIIARKMFAKAFVNKPGYAQGYDYLTPKQQAAVKAEMKNANLIQFSKTLNKAKAMVNRPDAPQKGISVWDFDDTLATTKSNVLYTLPDGTKGKINATEFALKADKLAAQGAEFDFSEFKKVMEGAKGPMFNKAVARNKKFGNDNVFILTARPADSKYAIHDFLSAIGLNIKIENIVGLGDGTALAKAQWVVGKVAEGYNDFYFADDAYKNVKAVQEVLEEADVKSKVHQAKVQFSKNLSKEFNNIIEDVTGIESFKTFSEAKGKVRGQGKGKYKFFIPPSADDFAGLLYKLTGKGKTGEAQQAWFKEALFDPFAKAMREFESYKQNVTGIVNQLKKDIKNVPSGLKKVNETGFTNEVAVRVYLWAKNGYDINGLSETDKKELIAVVQANQDLLDFADQMDSVLEGYPEPQNDWLAGTITTDAINMINTVKRAEFLEAWQNNADAIFTKENFNKLRAAFGDNYVEAMQDMLYRMKTGRNRPSGANKLTNKFMNWVNDSVGTIMFFNTRSALLQTLSIVNFINWGDNNPMAAAKAFANQKQFWSDFAMLFNSDFLKQRRSGLKNDVNADDIANAAETATNKTKAVLSSILKMGFLPTQIADSFAIAVGGASFVRNRINKYVSEGMDKQAAEEQAFLDFQEVAEETQQSSRPDRVSQQQASPLGRIILAFANTPMQYMRLTKKAFLDLKNGRGDAKTNITKIAYYMAVQNIIFSALQSALFAGLFDDDEEALDNKQTRVANSMLDSILRGVGVYGAIASTLKNIAIEIKSQAEKDRPDFTVAAQRALSISPPIDSKMRKLMGAGRAFSYKTTREKMVGFGLDNPAFYAGGQVVSALTNVPLDRAIRKADNLRVAVDNDTKYWQSLALLLGYSQWDLGLVESNKNTKKKSNWGSTTKWKKKGSWKKEKGSWKK
jgi:hypothetical protein